MSGRPALKTHLDFLQVLNWPSVLASVNKIRLLYDLENASGPTLKFF